MKPYPFNSSIVAYAGIISAVLTFFFYFKKQVLMHLTAFNTKKNKKIVLMGLAVSSLLITFIFQFYKIYHSGIGTDEGNFLYATKLIQNGKTIFFDFYSREGGSLMVLVPFFKFLETTIINLRYLVLGIHLLTIFTFYLCLKTISDNKTRNLLVVGTSSIILSFGGPFEIYTGIFYQLYALLSVLLFYFILKFNEDEKRIWLLGILSGLSILVYKGAEVFLLLIPLAIFLKQNNQKEYLKKILLFFFLSLGVIILYWVYYGLKENFHDIYYLVLSDVVRNYFITFLVSLTGIFFLAQNSLIKKTENLVISLNMLFYAGLAYSFSREASSLFSSFYGGVILEYSFLLMLLQYLNINYSGRYAKPLLFGYMTTNLLILILGFGSRGFFTVVPSVYHIFSTVLFLVYNIILGFKFLFEKIPVERKSDAKLTITLMLTAFFILNGFFGGYLIPTRFYSLLYFLPILVLSFILTGPWNKFKISILTLATVSAGFSVMINTTLSNDYTFYTIDNFTESVKYLKENLKSTDKVFSVDTSVLSEINNGGIINFYSPWQFSGLENRICSGYPRRGKEDVCLRVEGVINRVKETKPDYIIGSGRSTFRLFDNIEGGYILNSTYVLKKTDRRISIYKKIN